MASSIQKASTMAPRMKPDFFETRFGHQAALMNAWILWRYRIKQEPWSMADLADALPCVTTSAVDPHIRRLLKSGRRGEYLFQSDDGKFHVNPDRLPEWLYE